MAPYKEEMMTLFLEGHKYDVENLDKSQWRSQRHWVELTGIPKSTIQRRWGMKEVKPHGGRGQPKSLTPEAEKKLAERVSEYKFSHSRGA